MTQLREAPKCAQAIRKARREHKAGHDRVGVAEIRQAVVVLQDLGKGDQAADEVDDEHPRDGVAAELIHRHDSGGRRLKGLIAGH